MLEMVPVLEIIISALVVALAIDNISLRFKIKNVEEGIQLVKASLSSAVSAEFETVHGRVDAAFDMVKKMKLQAAVLVDEAETSIGKEQGIIESEVSKLKVDVLTIGGATGTSITKNNS